MVGPDCVRVAYPRNRVRQAPAIGADDVLPAEDEPAVFAHNELPYATGAAGERRPACRRGSSPSAVAGAAGEGRSAQSSSAGE